MSTEKCIVCDETVDSDELLSIDGFLYHNTCFKCSQCHGNLMEDNYFSLDGILFCKPDFEKRFKKNKRLSRKLSLPKPSELRKSTSSRLSSIFFKTQANRAISEKCAIPRWKKREAQDTISEANGDDVSASNALTITSESLPFTRDQLDLDTILNGDLPSDDDQMDLNTIMNQLMQNLAGVSYQTDIESQDFLRIMLDQITQNPEIMNAINQVGQQMDGNQDLGSMFAAMSECQGGGDSGASGDLDMSFMVQQMMPFLSQALRRGGSSSNLLEQDPSMKHEHYRRCYSDSESLSGLPMDCQMSLKEAAQKIEEEYPCVEVFSSVVETAALLHDNVYDIYGLAELCSEEELAEEFMEMLKHDVCRRLGKRYVRCNIV